MPNLKLSELWDVASKGRDKIESGEGILLPVLSINGNWFGIPLTSTFCGNQVLIKANFSPNKYRNTLNC